MMYKIFENLYIGSLNDMYESLANWNGTFDKEISICGVCKEPLHRRKARLQGSNVDGYIGRAMPKNEPEYLYAEREHALYCNLIDVDDKKYIPDQIIDRALRFIEDELSLGRSVFIVCNKGESRSPSIAFMYLIDKDMFDKSLSFDEVEQDFVLRYCNVYKPRKGFRDYTKNFWEDYINGN